jgi:hypothetical protein
MMRKYNDNNGSLKARVCVRLDCALHITEGV